MSKRTKKELEENWMDDVTGENQFVEEVEMEEDPESEGVVDMRELDPEEEVEDGWEDDEEEEDECEDDYEEDDGYDGDVSKDESDWLQAHKNQLPEMWETWDYGYGCQAERCSCGYSGNGFHEEHTACPAYEKDDPTLCTKHCKLRIQQVGTTPAQPCERKYECWNAGMEYGERGHLDCKSCPNYDGKDERTFLENNIQNLPNYEEESFDGDCDWERSTGFFLCQYAEDNDAECPAYVNNNPALCQSCQYCKKDEGEDEEEDEDKDEKKNETWADTLPIGEPEDHSLSPSKVPSNIPSDTGDFTILRFEIERNGNWDEIKFQSVLDLQQKTALLEQSEPHNACYMTYEDSTNGNEFGYEFKDPKEAREVFDKLLDPNELYEFRSGVFQALTVLAMAKGQSHQAHQASKITSMFAGSGTQVIGVGPGYGPTIGIGPGGASIGPAGAPGSNISQEKMKVFWEVKPKEDPYKENLKMDYIGITFSDGNTTMTDNYPDLITALKKLDGFKHYPDFFRMLELKLDDKQKLIYDYKESKEIVSKLLSKDLSVMNKFGLLE